MALMRTISALRGPMTQASRSYVGVAYLAEASLPSSNGLPGQQLTAYTQSHHLAVASNWQGSFIGVNYISPEVIPTSKIVTSATEEMTAFTQSPADSAYSTQQKPKLNIEINAQETPLSHNIKSRWVIQRTI